MRLARWFLLIGCLAMAAAWLPACAEEEDPEPTADEWMDRGKKLLSEGDGAGAYIAFQEVLDLRSHSLQAHYGVILADVLQFVSTVDLLTAVLESQEAPAIPIEEAAAVCRRLEECAFLEEMGATYDDCLADELYAYDEETRACLLAAPDCDTARDRCFGLFMPPGPELCADACVRFGSCGFLAEINTTVATCVESCPQLYLLGELECFMAKDSCDAGRADCFAHVGGTVTALAQQIWPPVGEEIAHDVEEIAGDPDFAFELDYYTFTLIDPLFRPVFSGVHDESDIYFFAAVADGIDALFSGVLGLNLDFNPQLLTALGLGDVTDLLDFLSVEDDPATDDLLAQIQQAIGWILTDPAYADFLALAPEGAESVQRAGVQIGMAFANIATLIEHVAAETDPQDDDVIRYDDANGNGVWNSPEQLIIPGVVELDYDLAWIVHDLCLALKVDFADGYPFRFEELNPLFDYLGLGFISGLIDLLDLQGIDSIDLGAVFRDPDPRGLRPLLAEIDELLQLTETTAPSAAR